VVASANAAAAAVGVEDYAYEFISRDELEQILCPITGTPMKDPVVAADGRTYER